MCIVTAITHTDTGTERERERERERSLTETEAYRGVIRGFGVWFIFICFCVKVYLGFDSFQGVYENGGV